MNPILPVPFLGRKVGVGESCFIIAEIGLNHNGDSAIAQRLIEVAAQSGCDAVKFQKRDVANLAIGSVLDAQDERFPDFGSTYRDIRDHLEFDKEEFKTLINCASRWNIPFFCTPFDIASANFLESLGMAAYKLASHSLTNIPLLEYIAATGKPTVMSTGMALLEEVDQAVAIFLSKGTPLILLHCVSTYPTPPDLANLKLIDFYRERYRIPVGYSGHEIGWLPSLGAVARGACALERHITLDNKMAGFDHKLSLNPEDLAQMVKDIRSLEKSLGDGKKNILEPEWVTRKKYHVSWVSKVPICAGELISESMITLKNPGTGIPAYRKDLVVHRRAKVDIAQDTLIETSFLESVKEENRVIN